MRHILVLLAAAAVMPDLNQLNRMSARFAPVTLNYDAAALSAGDRKALPKLVEAARVLNHLFLDQLWSGNRELYAKLLQDTTPLGKARLHRSEEHTSELQSPCNLVCRLLLEKKQTEELAPVHDERAAARRIEHAGGGQV